ncbi:DUF5004 domain-containing protein [Christiangramia fulva]|nr:DUF5004 domain-containing protein [Christiangramia fulva]
MKKIFFSLAIFSMMLQSCSKETMSEQNDMLKVSNLTTVTSNDLLGSWDLSKMTADTLVDLNDDGSASTNLLSETSCFNNMDITFNSDGTFISTNATMSFESGTEANKFSCMGDRIDQGDWEVRNDSLIMTLLINNVTYIHKKAIELGSNTFGFEVSKLESNLYVNDPGNTQASEIRILALEYTKR